jgi:hypothetical protein
MEDWLQVVWNRRPRILLGKQRMLVLDAFNTEYESCNNTELLVITEG